MNKDAIMNVLHKGSDIEGTVKINGSVRIDGKIKGKVKASEKIIVGQTGVIEGDLKAKEVTLSGKCTGCIIAEDKAIFHSTAEFDGEISCKQLLVEEGVVIDGNINMKEKREKVAQGTEKKG